MKDASNKRRMFGKLGVLAAAAIILPLTATIVPAVHADESVDLAKPAKKPVKVIRISMGTVVDGKPTGTVVKTVSRDGTAYIFRSDKTLSDDEVEQLIDKTQQSREAAAVARGEAEAARGEAEAARGSAEATRANADAARGHAEAMRVNAMAMAANYIPEIDISEITKNCREGQPVTTNAEGFDSTNKSRIRIVMCGKGQSKQARREAIQGLREARSEIASDKDMPEGVRKNVIDGLEKQIRKLEDEANEAS